MWIASKFGWFSIVQTPAGKSWQVRARSRNDLNELKTASRVRGRIIETTESDYRFRMIVDEADYSRIVDCMWRSIDYPDFKGMIFERKSQKDKLPWYHNVWLQMREYQEKRKNRK